MTAVAPLPGMPSVINGTIWPATVAVEAVCGATMPSAMPLPSSLRRLQYWASVPYETKDAIVAPAPGMIPRMMPRIVLRASVGLIAHTSFSDGKRVATSPPACRGGV